MLPSALMKAVQLGSNCLERHVIKRLSHRRRHTWYMTDKTAMKCLPSAVRISVTPTEGRVVMDSWWIKKKKFSQRHSQWFHCLFFLFFRPIRHIVADESSDPCVTVYCNYIFFSLFWCQPPCSSPGVSQFGCPDTVFFTHRIWIFQPWMSADTIPVWYQHGTDDNFD